MAAIDNSGSPMDETDDKQGLSCTLDMFKEYDEIITMILQVPIDAKKPLVAEKRFEDFKTIVDQYQEQPHLLDPHLEGLLDHLVNSIRKTDATNEERSLSYKYLWLLIKVRGYKYVVKKMPHEVKDLIPVLTLLEDQQPDEDFHGSYVLLMWLSIILYMPFDIKKFDVSSYHKENNEQNTIVKRIIAVVKRYMEVNHSSREMAAYLGSRFFTRPDLIDQYLPGFIDYCFEVLKRDENETRLVLFHKMGSLRTLGLIFKNGKREELLGHGGPVLTKLLASDMLQREDTPLQRYSIKLVQRIGLTFLKPRLASWRYQRGNRSLAINMVDKQNKKIEEVHDDDQDVHPCMEDVIDVLLQGIKNQDTIVRWSAAKGIGRVTSRLPRELADDVVAAILDMFSSQESDKAWHGGCLALAELARRGLFLPDRFSEVLPILEKALVYDELRGQSSIGSNIRDAACYLSWAFARAYHPDQMAPYVNKLATGLLIVSLFDREIPCRRAGSAAFQEHVGRQGTFPYGIEILTAVDYFAVGNRTNAYLSLSVHVGQYKTYTIPLIKHLVDRKMGHWDDNVRLLTAQALANLTQFEPDFISNTVLPSIVKLCTCLSLIQRHGAILATGHIILALAKVSQQKDYIGSEIIDEICKVAAELEERKLYKGMGGEYMKQATTVLIGKCAQAGIPITDVTVLNKWHDILEECLIYVDENLRQESLNALVPLWSQYYADDTEWQEALINRYISSLDGSIENHTIGYASGLGSMPLKFVTGRFNKVLTALIQTTKITTHTTWAKARKEAIGSITKLIQTVGFNINGEADNCLCPSNVSLVYDCLLNALNDYTMDRRGDIGAWVRETSMQSLEVITKAICVNDSTSLSLHTYQQIIGNLSRQAVERIDRTRKIAGKTFQAFLYGMNLTILPRSTELKEIFNEEWCADCNWASESTTFGKFVEILDLKEYRTKILLGLTYSLGGTSANLSRFTCDAIQNYLNSRLDSPELLHQFVITFLELFETYQKQDRIVLPLIKSLSEILSSCNALDTVLEKDEALLRKLISALRKECLKCTDYYKLAAVIPVFCELLRIESQCTKLILTQLSIFLGYQYPKVRALTATSLLTALQEYNEHMIIPEDSLDFVCDILEDTPWMGTIEEARQQRNKICELIGVQAPLAKSKPT